VQHRVRGGEGGSVASNSTCWNYMNNLIQPACPEFGATMPLPSHILNNARELRTKQTDAETLLWHFLRNRDFCGFKFRRQHPVGGYILDFYCHEAELAIELDGSGHAEDEQKDCDSERTKVLEGAGIRVMRFWNNEVLKELESVLEEIHAAASVLRWTPLTRSAPTLSLDGEGL